MSTETSDTSSQTVEKEEKTFQIFGRKVKQSDAIKAIGLLVFFAIMIAIVAFLWSNLSLLFEEDGLTKVIESIKEQGAAGVAILFALQFLQIVIAFIPGEVTQMAAGALYGPLWGTIIIWVGCVVSSSFIYLLVHKLGAPFVQSMVSTEHLAKFQAFEDSGKLAIVVFVLFLIPAMPKDVFTYLVPLTHMPMKQFVLLSNTARLPGIIISTSAAAGIVGGNLTLGIAILVIALIFVVIGFVFKDKIFKKLESLGK